MAEGPARAESPPPPASEPRGARAPLVPLSTERGASDPREGWPRCREAPAAVLPGPARLRGSARRSDPRVGRTAAELCRKTRLLPRVPPSSDRATCESCGRPEGAGGRRGGLGRAASTAVELRFNPWLDDGNTRTKAAVCSQFLNSNESSHELCFALGFAEEGVMHRNFIQALRRLGFLQLALRWCL